MEKEYQDMEMIVATVNDYFQGMYLGDMKRLRGAFAEEALVTGYFKEARSFLTVDQFIGYAEQSPVPKEKGEAYDMKIISVDITDTVAMVKVEDLYLGLRFTDYLSLLKYDDKWLIVNKIYRHA